MMKAVILATLLLAMLLHSDACPSGVPDKLINPITANSLIFDLPEQSKESEILQVPDTHAFYLRLRSNPSTGYSWRLHSKLPSCFSLLACQYNRDTSGRLGAAGEEIWELISNDIGKYQVDLEYQRSWLNIKDAPDASFIVDVIDQAEWKRY